MKDTHGSMLRLASLGHADTGRSPNKVSRIVSGWGFSFFLNKLNMIPPGSFGYCLARIIDDSSPKQQAAASCGLLFPIAGRLRANLDRESARCLHIKAIRVTRILWRRYVKTIRFEAAMDFIHRFFSV